MPLVLVSCSVSSTPGAATSTTDQRGTAPPVVLEPDGLGAVVLGEPADLVVDELTSLIGSPDDDTDWIDGTSGVFGVCPSPLRVVSWGSLSTFFSGGPDASALFAYSYGFDFGEALAGVDPRGLDLTTAAGIGIGTAVAELDDPAVVIDGDAAIDVWEFTIDGTADPHLQGQVTGTDDTDTVLFIETSTGCN